MLTVIPSARTIEYKGHTLVVVPHRTDEVHILHNLGIEVPPPVEHYYDWPGRYKPFEHQKVTTSFLAKHNRAFCLSGLGTGKTISTLWAYDFLRAEGSVRKAIIITPLSTLERAWGDEIFRNFPHLTFTVLHGARDKRFKLLQQDVDIYLVNHDGAKILAAEIAKRDDIDVVIIDEIAQAARNAGTDRWKALNTIAKGRPRVWGLTGTPTPNSPTDAWAQCRLVVPERVPPYYGRFRDGVMKQLNQFKWVPRDSATQTVAEAMQPSIRYKREDCIDLPPVMYETRSVEMSPEQKRMYKDMVSKLHAEYEGDQVTAVNEAVKAMKLVQIASGSVYRNDGEGVVIPAQERLSVTQEIIEEAGSKVIVFVPFTSALENVAEHLRKELDPTGYARRKQGLDGFTDVEVIQGSTSKGDRDAIFKAFQNTAEIRVIVAQPASMSHGLTLTAASVIIWFAPVNSHETYEQACGRITRPGQKLNQLIVNIEGSPVERAIYERLQHKGKMQGLLLDLLKEKETA